MYYGVLSFYLSRNCSNIGTEIYSLVSAVTLFFNPDSKIDRGFNSTLDDGVKVDMIDAQPFGKFFLLHVCLFHKDKNKQCSFICQALNKQF